MFKQSLQRIVEGCNGALGAILMGYDGIAVDQASGSDADVDLNLMGIEYSNIIKEIRQTAEVLENGHLDEISLKTDRCYIVIRHLTAEYFVALVLDRQGNFGQGRYLLLREAFTLREGLLS